MSSTTTSTRLAKWDNAKAALILLVVIGHGISAYWGQSDVLRTLDLWIYSFHMPLFIFICGIFSKSTVNSSPFKYDKIIGFFLLFYFMKLSLYLVDLLFGKNPKFSFISDNSSPWFIFALGVMFLVARFLRSCEPAKILILSFLVALLVGYIPEIKNTLVLSRIFVFFPLFYLGYMLDPNKVAAFLNKPLVRIVSAIILIVFTACVFFAGERIWPLRYLFTANHPYKDFGEFWMPFGPILRTAAYLISITVSAAVLSLIPSKKIPLFSYCGTKTLTIYALHRPVQRIIEYSPFGALLSPCNPSVILLVSALISVGLCLLFSVGFFDYVIYPCTNWRRFFSPLIKFFSKKKNPQE